MPQAAQFLPDAASLSDDTGIDLDIGQCSGCGLVQLSGDPVSYYRDVIRAAAFSDEMRSFRIDQFFGFVGKYGLGGKKVIEIGCGKGEYLALMNQSGAEAYGVEHLPESVDYCLRAGLRVSQGFVEDERYMIDGGPFDAFFILNFLEHLPDPNSLLRGVRCNLSDGGIGLVEVPNFDMIVRNKLFSEFTSDHLFYFTKDTLATVLRLNGFEILECTEIWYDYILSVIVRKSERMDLASFAGYQERITTEIHSFIDQFENGRTAIWGAGHQALAIVSLAQLGNRIRYIIDSAPFKQGRFSPATHVPIVSPDSLDTDPVDAIIVMAASYSDEVARIIRSRYDKKLCVSILRDDGLETV